MRTSRARVRGVRGLVVLAAMLLFANVLFPVASTPQAVAAVPNPANGSSVVTVRVGGDRNGASTVAGLSGVVLELQTGNGSPSGSRADGGAGWARCTSDADGDCNFTVPNTGWGGSNRDKRFWVVQVSAPAGWTTNDSFYTGNAEDGRRATKYAFRTPELTSGNTYSSQGQFMQGSGRETDNASQGIWQNSRTNPAMPQQCGLNVALILDLSNSVYNAGAVASLRGATNDFVDALVGTPSRAALFNFGTNTPVLQTQPNYPDLTPVTTQSQANSFKNRYSSWVTPTQVGNANAGGTNWDQPFYNAALSSGVVGTTNHYDVAIVLTDGNPTFYGPRDGGAGNGNYTRFREMENSIYSANALKKNGTRVLAVGVGDGASGQTAQNLAAISGPTAFSGSNAMTADYFQASNYEAAAQALRDVIDEMCESSITVTKMLVPDTNSDGDLSGATPAGAGWTFTATSPVVQGNPARRTTDNSGTGSVSFQMDFTSTTSSQVSVTEAQQDGYEFVGQTCTVRDDAGQSQPLNSTAITDASNPGLRVGVEAGQQVSCIVYNRTARAAEVTVNKTWVVNGQQFANGAQPTDLGAGLVLSGPGTAPGTSQGWSVPRGGYTVGETAGISEGMFYGALGLCRLTSATVTSINGATVNAKLPVVEGALPGSSGPFYQFKLEQSSTVVEVRNVVDCTTELTLAKQVQGGDADPTDWTLSAIGPNGALPGPSGVSGSPEVTNVKVTPGALYQLAESAGDPRYVQVDNRARPIANPLSTGSMSCTYVDANGNATSGQIEGVNGGATVPLGQRMKCTATNQTATLTVLKNVADPIDGGHTAADWDLTATPAGGVTGLQPETRDGAETANAQNTYAVRPGHVYTLSESGPAGYTGKLQRQTGTDGSGKPIWEDVAGFDVQVAATEHQTYRFVNTRQTGSISWRKIVGGTVSSANPSGSPLGGSTWQIVGPGHPANNPLIVQDTDGDGAFEVKDLEWGEYTVTETATAVGYQLGNPAPWFTVVINGDNLNYVHAVPLENPQTQNVVLPVTGGSGTTPYVIGGSVIVLVALVLLGWRPARTAIAERRNRRAATQPID